MEKVRLDKYLAKVLGVPRAQIAHLIDKKMVLVNGVVAKKSGLLVGKSDRVEILQNAESTLDSALAQNLNKNNPRVSVNLESRPLRGAKNRDKGCRSATADFLLEAEKRGSPPKSEKAAAFWRVGGAGRGVQPFLRENKNNNEITESNLDSADSQNLPHIQRIYEDDDILVLNKPPFLATHGAPSLKEPSLVEWLKARKIQRSTISGELREGIVHRLDKQTSGALVVAKNNDAHNAISAQLADKTMGRLYLAIIDLPLKEDIEIECYLARNPKNRLKISKVDMRKYKKFAETQKELCEAPENSPASWCKKSDSKGAVVPPADFLLEAEKRGSPPKSEKRQLLGTHFKKVGGSGAGGAALLRKESSENSGNKNAESIRDSQSGLPRAINCARNDNSFRDSSPTAQNDKVKNSQNLPKFARYSKSKFYKLLTSKDGKKELILAKLFTGRTHQIRAHLESINRHIVGDELYGYKRGGGEDERVMLHAYLLELTHPKESSADNSPLGLHSADLVNFGRCADFSLALRPKFTKNHESQTENPSVVDSANPKLRFIAPLFDDMKDYLAKNFDMEKVYEILHGLPARAF